MNRELERKIEEDKEGEIEVRGVLFVQHTQNSELAKRIRRKLTDMENISSLRVKIVERAGVKIVDALHKSNPWEETNCQREDCMFCNGNNEKMIGKCKQRGVVYETLCMLCERKRKSSEEETIENTEIENTGVKRKREQVKEMREAERKEEEKRKQTKYIGETSRSGYERMREHMKDFSNLSKKSHILKHYLDCHKEASMEEMEMGVRIIWRYRTSFERQIGESVEINYNMGIGTKLLN